MDARRLAELSQLLDRELDCARRLLEVIGEERTSLTGADPAAVLAVADTKQRLLQDFDAAERARQSCLQALGLSADRAAMERLMGDAPARAAIGRRWDTLLGLLRDLRDGNDTNGRIVSLRQRQTKELLNVLYRGRPDELTYGRAGTGHAALSRALGRV